MAFIDPFKKIRCPYCNESFYPAEYSIVSRLHPSKTLYASPRAKGVSHQVTTPVGGPMGQTLPSVQNQPTNGKPSLLSRFWMKPPDAYKGEMACFKCPECGSMLPHNITEVEDNITIAIIGDTFSGKTHYIASLIEQLQNLLLPQHYFHVMPASQDIHDLYKNKFYDPLFRLNNPFQPNPQASNTSADPLIYKITIGETPETGRSFNLFFYDASGEDMVNQINMGRYRPHILNARALIYLADPWVMPKFVKHLPHHLKPDPQLIPTYRAAEALNWVIETFRRVRPELNKETLFSLPTAIVMTKCDLIEQYALVGNNQAYEYLYRADLAGLYNTDGQNVDNIVRQFMQDLGEDALLSVSQSLRVKQFFAVSATGAAPVEDPQRPGTLRYPGGIKPHRCTDPLLWILRELNILE